MPVASAIAAIAPGFSAFHKSLTICALDASVSRTS
jgi:hypothetical protein